jgi:hypothetical protein
MKILSYRPEAWKMTSEQISALRVFDRKTTKNLWSHKRRHWRIRTNKGRQATLQEADIVKFIKSLRLRWYGHHEIPKQITARTQGTGKRGRSQKTWTDEVEEDLKIMGI